MITIIGDISESTRSFSLNGKRNWFLSEISAERKSGFVDSIPILFEDDPHIEVGDRIHIEGNVCSYNIDSHTRYFVLVRQFYVTVHEQHANFARITGHICKIPCQRQTPSGRTITNLLVAVTGPNAHSDYLPCIVWEQFSDFAKNLSVGDSVDIMGRLQSREYIKNDATHTAYEISVSNIMYN